MDPLALFYANESQREAVKAFMVRVLGEITVEKAFAGDDVGGIKDARLMIETTFDKLEETYGIIEPSTVSNSR